MPPVYSSTGGGHSRLTKIFLCKKSLHSREGLIRPNCWLY